jgi:hypothetical protein
MPVYFLQVGGGDQIYNDPVFELPSLKPWLAIDDPHVSVRDIVVPKQAPV